MIGDKVVLIMQELEPIKKTACNESTNYKFAPADKVVEAVKPLLVKYKIITVPKKLMDIKVSDNEALLSIAYEFIDTEDPNLSSIIVEVAGQGDNTYKRGVYSATTGAWRYAVKQLFAIEEEDDPDDPNKSEGSNGDSNSENLNNSSITDEDIEQIESENSSSNNPEESQIPSDANSINEENLDSLFQ